MSSSALRLIVVLAVLAAAGFFVVQTLLDSGGTSDVTVEETPSTTLREETPLETPEEVPARREAVAAETAPERNVEQAEAVVQAGTGTGTMSGVVLNKQRQPVQDATVTLAFGPQNLTFHLPSSRKRTDRSVKTAADGTYSFEGLAAADNYVVIVEHPDYALEEQEGVAVRESDFVLVPDIILGHGGLVHGVVAGPEGILLANADVELWDTLDANFRSPGDKAPWKTTKTDAAGRYSFSNVHFNACEVVVSAEGYATASRANTTIFSEIEDRELNFELSLANAIRGLVLDEQNRPVPNATLEAFQLGKGPVDRGMSKGRAVSDAGGSFTLNGLADGNYNISAKAPGYSDQTHVAAARASDVRIVLQRRGGVTGVVRVKATGAPVTDFAISVLRRHADHEPAPMGRTERFSSPDGTFTLTDLDPFNYVFEATAKGFAPGRSQEVFVQRGGTASGVTIELDEGATVTGVVVDSAGAPVAGAEVKLNPNNFVSNTILDIFSNLPNAPKKHEWATRTKKDGRFTLKLVVPGTYQVEVAMTGYSRKAINDVQLTGGQTADLGRQVVSSGGSITGTCRDASGQPVADGTVHCQGPNGWMDQKKPDYDGRFEFQNLEPGDYKLTLQPDKMQGKPVNPLMKILYAQKTEQAVQVREGANAQVQLNLPPMQE